MPEDIKLTKLPPQSLENEMAVLGSMLLDREQISVCMNILTAKDFYAGKNGAIFQIMVKTFEKDKPVDMTTLIEALNTKGLLEKCGGPMYLTSLLEATPTPKSAEAYARTVAQKSIMRQMIATANDIVSRGYNDDGDFSEYLDGAEKKILDITRVKSLRASEDRVARNTRTTLSFAVDVYKEMKERMRTKNLMKGIPTGFTILDLITRGFRNKDVITIAGREGTGKTS